MAYCPNCGAPATGRFCGTCGANTQGGGGNTPPPGSPGPGPGPTGTAPAALPDNIAGALCYSLGPLTGILFLAMEPYSQKREIRFHAWQSIFLFGGLMVGYLALAMFGVILPRFVTVLLGLMMLLLQFASIGAWLLLMYQTYNGQKVVLPVIGPLAEQKA